MGTDFQLVGSQPDKYLQDNCLAYMREMVRLQRRAEQEEGQAEREMIAEHTPIYLDGELTFYIDDAALGGLISGYQGASVFSADRFNGNSPGFMFDTAHDGLITSTTWFPKSSKTNHLDCDVPIVGAGIRYRGPADSGLPIEAIMYYVMYLRFVPNLIINDDHLFYQGWFNLLERDSAFNGFLRRASAQQLLTVSMDMYRLYSILAGGSDDEEEGPWC
jgi:hypothetical protein